MKNLIKIIGFAFALLLSQSCASFYRGIGTVEPCLPRDKDELILKEKIQSYISNSYSACSVKITNNPIIKQREIGLKYNIRF